jgi:hypothetical protein
MTKCQDCGKIIQAGAAIQIPAGPYAEREPLLKQVTVCFLCLKKRL